VIESGSACACKCVCNDGQKISHKKAINLSRKINDTECGRKSVLNSPSRNHGGDFYTLKINLISI
jgi:hypothetical protein